MRLTLNIIRTPTQIATAIEVRVNHRFAVATVRAALSIGIVLAGMS